MWYESIPSCKMIFWILALNSTGKIYASKTDYKTERIFSFECFIQEISKFKKVFKKLLSMYEFIQMWYEYVHMLDEFIPHLYEFIHRQLFF